MKNLKPMPTHEAVVEKHLKRYGSITTLKAFDLKKKKITRLAAHIFELKKKKKMKIKSIRVTTKDGWYVRYKLVA